MRAPSHIARLADEVRNSFGSLDLVFLDAGISGSDALDDIFQTKVKGTVFTLQAVAPELDEGASVVVTVGLGAMRGMPGPGRWPSWLPSSGRRGPRTSPARTSWWEAGPDSVCRTRCQTVSG